MNGIALPENCSFQHFDGDLLLIGPGLTAEVYETIRSTLPTEVRERLIGWKRIGQG